MAGKYESMIHYFTPEDADFGPWSNSPQPFLHGEKDIPDVPKDTIGEINCNYYISKINEQTQIAIQSIQCFDTDP